MFYFVKATKDIRILLAKIFYPNRRCKTDSFADLSNTLYIFSLVLNMPLVHFLFIDIIYA